MEQDLTDEDHPRSRGVYRNSTAAPGPHVGSSPLARGLLRLNRIVRANIRIIPARAGFTGRLGGMRGGRRDHPRSRGVYAAVGDPVRVGVGSSPLARGLHGADHVGPVGRGIIPARAGFTGRAAAAPCSHWDHPRSRGVYKSWLIPLVVHVGSSPLARGLPAHDGGSNGEGGIIPARAGFTPSSSPPKSRTQDHPRSRGVYSRYRRGRASGMGSSPLARGLLRRLSPTPRNIRIIPARAGFTPMSSSFSRPPSGSSPLARGLPPPSRSRGRGRGIIPARAGFTRGRAAHPPNSRDHPRSRGVYDYVTRDFMRKPGSSPLARGLLGAISR